jgi:lipopolysaccharide/colanic/teichoic acid biosynthesis glycosyltransferase
MSWLMIERPSVKLYNPSYQLLKRLFDVALCLILIPFVAIATIFIAVFIRLDSAGPIFFVQERVGKGGRSFKLIKFRTMHHNIDKSNHQKFMKAFIKGQVQEANSDHQTFKPFKSQQITQVGRILRKTSLDELPQLINIIKGEMSFVGPRPNVLWEVEEYHGWHKERLEVLPGITGLAQVRGRSGIIFDKIDEYDSEYINKQSFKLDLLIIWWTFKSVLVGNGAQ